MSSNDGGGEPGPEATAAGEGVSMLWSPFGSLEGVLPRVEDSTALPGLCLPGLAEAMLTSRGRPLSRNPFRATASSACSY